ncbi:hypothetical protein NP493_1127g01063 [Ridgeia piscesae]|uniref:Uncharacterized protein n=1 Tax=Ridgeia piscesae TaxID=27915 RepID=A0AAD9NI36_RIDPI|nr:hypothetical protein NP493_1127g01063 [Ridgeia piscesae]
MATVAITTAARDKFTQCEWDCLREYRTCLNRCEHVECTTAQTACINRCTRYKKVCFYHCYKNFGA